MPFSLSYTLAQLISSVLSTGVGGTRTICVLPLCWTGCLSKSCQHWTTVLGYKNTQHRRPPSPLTNEATVPSLFLTILRMHHLTFLLVLTFRGLCCLRMRHSKPKKGNFIKKMRIASQDGFMCRKNRMRGVDEPFTTSPIEFDIFTHCKSKHTFQFVGLTA